MENIKCYKKKWERQEHYFIMDTITNGIKLYFCDGVLSLEWGNNVEIFNKDGFDEITLPEFMCAFRRFVSHCREVFQKPIKINDEPGYYPVGHEDNNLAYYIQKGIFGDFKDHFKIVSFPNHYGSYGFFSIRSIVMNIVNEEKQDEILKFNNLLIDAIDFLWDILIPCFERMETDNDTFVIRDGGSTYAVFPTKDIMPVTEGWPEVFGVEEKKDKSKAISILEEIFDNRINQIQSSIRYKAVDNPMGDEVFLTLYSPWLGEKTVIIRVNTTTKEVCGVEDGGKCVDIQEMGDAKYLEPEQIATFIEKVKDFKKKLFETYG